MKKIAVPTDSMRMLDGHFGRAGFFTFIVVEDDKIVSEEVITPPPHQPGIIPKWLKDQSVTDVITGGMGDRAKQILSHHKINVFEGASRKTAASLVNAFLNDTLELNENNCHHH